MVCRRGECPKRTVEAENTTSDVCQRQSGDPYNDDLKRNVYTREVTLSKNKELPLTILSGGGIVIVK